MTARGITVVKKTSYASDFKGVMGFYFRSHSCMLTHNLGRCDCIAAS